VAEMRAQIKAEMIPVVKELLIEARKSGNNSTSQSLSVRQLLVRAGMVSLILGFGICLGSVLPLNALRNSSNTDLGATALHAG